MRETSGSRVETAYRQGFQVFQENLPVLLVLGLATCAAQFVRFEWIPGFGWLFGSAFAVLFEIPLEWGFAFVCLLAVRGETPVPRDLLRAFDHWVNAAAAAAMVYAMVIIGLVLLVVPGVYVYCRTRFVPYLMTQEDMHPVEAIRLSWHMTEDHLGSIFGICVVGLLLSCLGFLLAGIGIVPAIILWDLALASYYYSEVLSVEEAADALEDSALASDQEGQSSMM